MLYTYDKKSKTSVVLWESVMEPKEVTAREIKRDVNKSRASEPFKSDGGDHWLGAPSVMELQKRLKNGWVEGVKRLEQIAVKELDAPASIRRRRIKADQGDEIDMQAVWRGDLSRAWSKTRRLNRTGVRSVSIIVDLGANAGTDADRMFWRGASALRLADQLVTAGYNVAIYGAATAANPDTNNTMNAVQFVEIKAEDSPFDIDKLAALTAMPGFFRTSLFAGIAYCVDRQGKDTCGGYGSSAPELIAKALPLMPSIPQNAIIQSAKVLSKDAAEEWLAKAIEQIESPVLEAA